ncbi:MAG: hypothetical protein ACOYL3_01760 [Desulfuromonadaceae bacterium]
MTTLLGSKTLIFWGAGATAAIGQRGTLPQADFLKKLLNSEVSIVQRVRNALDKVSTHWDAHLSDLLNILGDSESDIYELSDMAKEAMRRHWTAQADNEIVARISELRSLFDWPALRAIIRICPGYDTEKGFQLNDLFNVLDMHLQSGHGFRTDNDQFISPNRVIAARKALEMLLHTLFYIDWQEARGSKKVELEKYHQFASMLTEYHQEKGLEQLANDCKTDTREFYLADIAFVSLNYDPICLWTQFIANRECNDNYPPHVDFPRVPLKIFHDFAHFMAVSRIGEPDVKNAHLWYPMNEASAQRLNDREHVTGRRVRIEKFLLPHGCVCWRECPSCGKLTAYFGQKWEIDSAALIPPPPLKGFWDGDSLLPRLPEEENAWLQGKVDARACTHCNVLTYTQHTITIMQSNFKGAPPPFIQEIQNELRVAVENAEHIILFGYSLPPDDVTYRAFFAARKKRKTKVYCSVVVGREFGDLWHGKDEIDCLLEIMKQNKPCEPPATTLQAACDIFGKDNVRFYGGGIPNVFCDGNTASKEKFNRLINWE